MKNKEIAGLSVEQIKTKIQEEQLNLKRLKFAHAVSPIENPMRIRNSRKTVARLLTALKAKELAK